MTTIMLNEKLAQQNRNLVLRFFQVLRQKAARQTLRKSLLEMPESQLRDIGLARHRILSDEF